MGAFLQYPRFRHWYMDQLADQEEEAPGFEEKGELKPSVRQKIS